MSPISPLRLTTPITARKRSRLMQFMAAATLLLAATVVVQPGPSAGADVIPRKLGAATYYDVMNAATQASSLCPEATPAALAATMLAPIWIEASAGEDGVPSPMAHSRWDNQPGLYHNAFAESFFWNPGIGIWQMDSAGLGRPWTAWQRVSTAVMAPVVAKYVATKYCAATGTELERARAAWGWRPTLGKFGTWHACNAATFTACDTVFNTLYNGTPTLQNLVLDTIVSSLGGMVPSACSDRTTGKTITCFFMDFTKAQGTTSGFLECKLCPTPVPKSYLSYTSPLGDERRQFYDAYGAIADVFAARPLDQDARTGLAWFIGVDSLIKSTYEPVPPPDPGIVLPQVE